MGDVPRTWAPVRAGLVIIVSGVLLLPGAARAAGQPGSASLCTFETRNHATPGFSMTPTKGVDRATGTISCRGTVSGQRVRETPGTIRFVFYYGTGEISRARGGDDCLAFSGHGTMEVTLPSDEGTITVHGPVESVVGAGAAAEIHGQLGSSSLSGLLQFLPDSDYPDENCVTKPIQHFITLGEMALNG